MMKNCSLLEVFGREEGRGRRKREVGVK